EPEQVAQFRHLGGAIAESLLAHLDADDPETALARLQEASTLAADYGLRCGRLELPLSEAVAAFLRFRGPFIDELARTARAAGLESTVPGENEVLRQVRDALATARRRGLDPRLARLFEMAIATGRRARSGDGRRQPGLAEQAVAWLNSRVRLARRPVVVAGT